jgi:Do/DeqQ family serine protease
MKQLTALFIAALLGGTVSIFGNKMMSDNQPITTNQTKKVPVKRVNYPVFSPEATVDFRVAAKNSVNAVVHVKTTFRSSQREMGYNPFYQFFFEREREMPERMGTGSGVIISGDGYIMTNNHVIDYASEVEVTLNDGRSYNADVIGADPNTDLALLKVNEANLPFIPYGNSEELSVGEWVLAVGNPFNLTSTVTAGIVSAKGRNINILQEEFAVESFIQTDAAVNPGNSGGALVNTRGELIGINTAIASQTGSFSGYSFAVPVNIARKVIQDILDFGEVQRAFIGVSIRNIDQTIMEKESLSTTDGAFVMGLSEGGAAGEAGIKRGDVIISVEGKEVRNVPELQEKVSSYRPGDLIDVAVLRDGKVLKKPVLLRNRKGNTDLLKRDGNLFASLGAQFEPIGQSTMSSLRISSGLKVTDLGNGKLKNAGIKEGFIITTVDRKPVVTVDDLTKVLNKMGDGVLLGGVYPNGRKAYYGFGM